MNNIQQLGLFSKKFEVCGRFVSLPLETRKHPKNEFCRTSNLQLFSLTYGQTTK